MRHRSSTAPALLAGLVIIAPTHDLGVVAPGSKVEHTFVLENPGPETHRITHVSAACGCTVASYDREIEPGSKGEVRATVDVTSLPPGPFAKTVDVETDDPDLPRVTLTLRGDLQPHVLANPNRLRWTVTAGAAGSETQTIVLSSRLHRDFVVTGVDTTDRWLIATFREASAAERPAASTGRVWLVEVKLDAGAPAGPIRGEVRVRTNQAEKPLTVVPVSGFIATRTVAASSQP